MKTDIYNRIIGYLDGISSIVSFYGVCYSHFYEFREYDNVIDISECVDTFYNSSLIKRHETKIIGLKELGDWKSELFKSCSDWFFSLFSMQKFEVTLQDDDGNKMPAQKHRESNYVFNGLLKLLEEFFKNENIKVYKLLTEPNWVDEFAWEQFFFQSGSKVYVLHFYQQG